MRLSYDKGRNGTAIGHGRERIMFYNSVGGFYCVSIVCPTPALIYCPQFGPEDCLVDKMAVALLDAIEDLYC